MSFEEEWNSLPQYEDAWDEYSFKEGWERGQKENKQRVKEILYAEGMNECVCGEDDCPRCAEGRMVKRILERLGL